MVEILSVVDGSVPLYVRSNASFYEQLAEEFYSTVYKEQDEETYRELFAGYCFKWRRDMTNEDVQDYLLKSGCMENEDIQAIRRFYIEHAEPFQQAMLSSGLKEGGKYTLLYLNEFGFPVLDRITFYRMAPKQYAQHTDAVSMVVRKAGARKSVRICLCNCSLAIYEGWHKIKDTDTYVCLDNQITEGGLVAVTTKRTKYSCFDARFFTDVVTRLGKPLLEYRIFVKAGDKMYA